MNTFLKLENYKNEDWIDLNIMILVSKTTFSFYKIDFTKSLSNWHKFWAEILVLRKKFKRLSFVTYGQNSLLLSWTPCISGSWKTRTGVSQPQVHTVMIGRVPIGHEFQPITVWTSGWENQFRFPNFLEEAFSEFILIT